MDAVNKVETRREIERCEECGQPINNGDHKDGKCGFWERVRLGAKQANIGIIINA